MILIVTSRYPFGSQESYLGTELAELTRHFARIAVAPVRSPGSAAARQLPDGVELVALPLLGGDVLLRAVRAFAAAPRRALGTLAELARSRDPGRVKNLAVALKGLALAQWAREHGVSHVHAYWVSTPATVAMIAAKVSGASWSATAHRWDIYERNAFDVKARSAAFVRAISRRGAEDVAARMPGVAGRVVQLRLGAVVPEIALPVPAADAFRIVCPAALVPVKGHADLFAALALLRARGVPVRCTLAGTGPLRRELELLAARLRIDDAVAFAGFVPQQTLHAWYRAGRFAAVVLASRASGAREMEGVPSALIEAMALGVPVVATDSGSVGELVDASCGLLVAPGDPDALARALREVAEDPERARERARRAHRTVAERHDVCTQMVALAAALRKAGA
ncbi:MAG TPA: glycosyltransferase [Candidatus Limnocylindria bacterium]|nr:glycosyltransferase [Candidatus Limnocylindria bacterium]